MITRPHHPCHVFAKRILCNHPTLNSPAGTSGNSSRRRQWPMPKTSSSGQRRPTYLPKVNHTFWWGSIVELKEEMKCYVSFSDKDVFSGMALPEKSPMTPPKEATPKDAQPAPANSPVKKAIMDVTMEPIRKKKPLNQFPGWENVLHPSRLVVAARQIPPSLRGLKQRPYSQSLWEGWYNNFKQ